MLHGTFILTIIHITYILKSFKMLETHYYLNAVRFYMSTQEMCGLLFHQNYTFPCDFIFSDLTLCSRRPPSRSLSLKDH